MKKSNIYLLLYNDILYLKESNNIEAIKLEKPVMYNGRLNNYNELEKKLRKSKIIIRSSFKLVYDKLNVIYFGNYTKLELENIKNLFNESGYERISLIDYISLLDTDNYDYFISNNNMYYVIINNHKYLTEKEEISYYVELANSKIISDRIAYYETLKNYEKAHIYAVDDIVKYLFNAIC